MLSISGFSDPSKDIDRTRVSAGMFNSVSRRGRINAYSDAFACRVSDEDLHEAKPARLAAGESPRNPRK
jgi:hypothetical protein